MAKNVGFLKFFGDFSSKFLAKNPSWIKNFLLVLGPTGSTPQPETPPPGPPTLGPWGGGVHPATFSQLAGWTPLGVLKEFSLWAGVQ